MTSPLSPETLRKRLLWRATHRGIKEMDILVGGFAQKNLAHMDEAQLEEFTRLMELPDQDLLAWATGTAEIPPQLDGQMLRDILAFRPASFA